MLATWLIIECLTPADNNPGDVLAGFGVEDDKILAVLDHGSEVLERNVGAGTGIVEAPVSVFFDCDWFFLVCHDVR